MKKFTILAALIIFFLSGASDVYACSCLMETKTPVSKQVKASYQKAAAVFYGEVTEITRESEGVIVKIKVEKSWKGELQGEVIVRTLADSAMCGYTFEKNMKYMVYADDNDGHFGVNLCSRTSQRGTDAKYLNKIKKPRLFAKITEKSSK